MALQGKDKRNEERLWTASVASCCTPMNTVLWLNAVTFSSPWANVDEPRSRSVVKTDYNRFKLATNARRGPKECVNGISAWLCAFRET